MVTGYVPIHGHTRTPQEYAKYGDALREALGEHIPAAYYNTVRELWMTPFLEKLALRGQPIAHSEGDNPQKNSVEYHAVQHQKFEWLARAANEDQESDTFVWLDYGCMRLPGFGADELQKFLKRVKKNDLAIPGCWEKKEVVDYYPCWRFCGTMFVVPRSDVFALNEAFKAVTRLYVRSMRSVTWEVNDLARLELAHVGPQIRWYLADHNATMLARYE